MSYHTTHRKPSGPYRSRQGMIFGVCRGLAEYFDSSIAGFRIGALLLMLFTGFWPIVVVYCIAAFLMKAEPVIPFESESDQEFYDSYARSRRMGVDRLKRSYDNLDRRLQRMESIVTSPDYQWKKRFHQ